MKTTLDYARELAARGFHVFPLLPGSKYPAIEDFPNRATTDPETIKKWWVDPVMGLPQPYNVGISTTRFNCADSLVVVDVDNKEGKTGDESLLRLEMQGKELPATYRQVTPTGGKHYVYVTPEPLKQGANVLGRGLDIRSRGGYIVGYGSTVEAGTYSGDWMEPAPAPDWLVEQCGRAPEKDPEAEAPEHIDQDRAIRQAIDYLQNRAPIALQGEAGDSTTYQVACMVKDYGVSQIACMDLMAEHWNTRCEPPWEPEDLADKISHAYKYGREPVGSNSPEAHFEPIVEDYQSDKADSLHPFERLNQEYAFVTTGGSHHILHETEDADGNPIVDHLNESSFHKRHASETLACGDGKNRPLTQLWMNSPDRRSYRGICFKPRGDHKTGYYNLWTGFAYPPADSSDHPTVRAFVEHAYENVCQRDDALFHWLMGYFAHLIQKPWEKPLVALVFRGSKGVGKNALVERVGALLGRHTMVTANRRYLVSNFTGHLERLLLFVLDEAFWSGDKQAEGNLKSLITGYTHSIEHKGKETYEVDNLLRVVIIGNEEWLVPASEDERRFAVFDVGEGRKQDKKFFKDMRVGMERGGYPYLLRYLLDFDLANVDVNEAPDTQALLDQKHASMNLVPQWWYECLQEGRIIGLDFVDGWVEELPKGKVHAGLKEYAARRNIRSRLPDCRSVGKYLVEMVPSIVTSQKMKDGDQYVNSYRFPDLDTARAEWEKYIKGEETWE